MDYALLILKALGYGLIGGLVVWGAILGLIIISVTLYYKLIGEE